MLTLAPPSSELRRLHSLKGTRLNQHDAYLGDGVYASFDGYQIWLRVERINGEHAIAIDDQCWASLVAYRERLLAALNPETGRDKE